MEVKSVLNIPFEMGDKGFGFALSIIADEDCGELLFLFFHDGMTTWWYDWEDEIEELDRESHNPQRTDEARAVLYSWKQSFQKQIDKMKEETIC